MDAKFKNGMTLMAIYSRVGRCDTLLLHKSARGNDAEKWIVANKFDYALGYTSSVEFDNGSDAYKTFGEWVTDDVTNLSGLEKRAEVMAMEA